MNFYTGTKPYPREHVQEAVHYLAEKYPACFFEDPGVRRPLKATHYGYRYNGHLPAVAVIQSLHSAGRISTDQLSKVTLPATPAPVRPPANSSPLLARLQTLLASTSGILLGTEDETLRVALARTSLKLLIAEAERLMSSLEVKEAAAE
jgi:hypothetical protein